jgi:sodium-independent sulfate anion transporter 11
MRGEKSIVIDYETLSIKEKVKRLSHQIPYFLKNYISGIFPIFHWIHKYNLSVIMTIFAISGHLSIQQRLILLYILQWFVQDMIAGITVGIVIVPQSMAYAKIANLDPQYGL